MDGGEALLITGMHRSGTSAAARVCNLLGVALGADIMQPGLDNVPGYWEHDTVVALHEELLKGLNSSWDNVAKLPPAWQDTLVARNIGRRLALVLDRELAAHGLWGVKDPRLCRLLPLWRLLFAERGTVPRVLLVLRHPLEVSDSLMRRDAFSRTKAVVLWLRYVLEVERNTRGLRRHLINYDALFTDWRGTFDVAGRWLGLEWPQPMETVAPKIEAFVSRGERHHWADSGASITGPVMETALDVHALLASPDGIHHGSVAAALDDASARLEGWDEEILECLLENPRTSIHVLQPLWRAANSWRKQAEIGARAFADDLDANRRQAAAFQATVAEEFRKVRDAASASSGQWAAVSRAQESMAADLDGLAHSMLTLGSRLETGFAGLRHELRQAGGGLGNLQAESARRSELLVAQLSQLSMAIADMDRRLDHYIEAEQQRRTLRYWLARIKGTLRALLFAAPLRSEQLREDDSTLRPGIKYSLDSIKYKDGNLFGFGWIFHKESKIAGVDIVVQRGGKVERLKCVYGGTRDDVHRDWPCPGAKSSGFWFTGRPVLGFGSRLWLEAHFEGPALRSALLPLPELAREDGWGSLAARWATRARKAAGYLRRGEFTLFAKQGARFLSRRFGSVAADVKQSGWSCLERALLCQEGRAAGLALIVDHNLGGGANLYREQYIRAKIGAGHRVLLLTYDLPAQSFKAALYSPGTQDIASPLESLAQLDALLHRLPPTEIFLNNLYTVGNVLTTVDWVRKLAEKCAAKLILPIHDFMSVCPSFTLINNQGKFCGVPLKSECEKCLPAHQGQFTNFVHCRDIGIWRDTWRSLLNRADEVICFSNDSASLLLRAYPELESGKLHVRPHKLDKQLRPPALQPGRIKVGVVGTIDANKGALVLRDIARMIQEMRLPIDVIVLGSVLEPVPDEYGVTVHGAYRRDELPDLLEKYQVNVCLFPSIWPETFSYVCEELMRMQVPLVAFDLGAPAERIRAYERGLLVKDISPAGALEGLQRLYTRIYAPRLVRPDAPAVVVQGPGARQGGLHA